MAKHAKHAYDPERDQAIGAEPSRNRTTESQGAAAPAASTQGEGEFFGAEDGFPDAEGALSADLIDVPAEPLTVAAYDVAGNNAPEAAQGLNLHQKKSRRMRIALLVASVILVALMGALAYFAFMLVNEANDVAYQSATQTDQANQVVEASDSKTSAATLGQAPSLVGLMGLTEEEALVSIGSGATETSAKDITEETGEGDQKKTEVVGKNVTLSLTDEPTDARGNAPSVYLTLDKDGKITEVGYAASLAALGYKDVSFSDAVKTEHVVEKLLTDAGIPTAEGSVELPAAEDYRTYAEDGKTIAQEQYTFSGQGTSADGTPRNWQCRLNYDYSAANVSGNLADTLRQVYVTVSAA